MTHQQHNFARTQEILYGLDMLRLARKEGHRAKMPLGGQGHNQDKYSKYNAPVMAALSKTPQTQKEIMEITGLSRDAVRFSLYRFHNRGTVVRRQVRANEMATWALA